MQRQHSHDARAQDPRFQDPRLQDARYGWGWSDIKDAVQDSASNLFDPVNTDLVTGVVDVVSDVIPGTVVEDKVNLLVSKTDEALSKVNVIANNVSSLISTANKLVSDAQSAVQDVEKYFKQIIILELVMLGALVLIIAGVVLSNVYLIRQARVKV